MLSKNSKYMYEIILGFKTQIFIRAIVKIPAACYFYRFLYTQNSTSEIICLFLIKIYSLNSISSTNFQAKQVL